MMQKMLKEYAWKDVKVTIPVGDKQAEITVHPVLPLAQFGAAAQDMCDMQFLAGEDGEMKYAPWLEPFARKYVLLTHFTDLDLSDLVKKTDGVNTISGAEPAWQLMWSGVIAKVLEEVDSYCWYDLLTAADRLVETKRKTTEPGPDRLWTKLSDLVDETKTALGEMTPEDGEKMRAAIEKLSGIDEEKIVKLMR